MKLALSCVASGLICAALAALVTYFAVDAARVKPRDERIKELEAREKDLLVQNEILGILAR